MQLESSKYVIHDVAIIPAIFLNFNQNQIDRLAININSKRNSSSNNISNSINYLRRNHEAVEAIAAVMPSVTVAVAVVAMAVAAPARAAIATATATVAPAATTLMATHGLHRLRAPD